MLEKSVDELEGYAIPPPFATELIEANPSDQDRVYAILIVRPGLDIELVEAYGRLH
jgi:hypothetical protein